MCLVLNIVTVIIHIAGDTRLVLQGVAVVVGYLGPCASPGRWEADHTPYRESLGIEVI